MISDELWQAPFNVKNGFIVFSSVEAVFVSFLLSKMTLRCAGQVVDFAGS